MRKILFFLSVVAAAVGVSAGPALADYCVNVGTPTGGPATVCVPD